MWGNVQGVRDPEDGRQSHVSRKPECLHDRRRLASGQLVSEIILWRWTPNKPLLLMLDESSGSVSIRDLLPKFPLVVVNSLTSGRTFPSPIELCSLSSSSSS